MPRHRHQHHRPEVMIGSYPVFAPNHGTSSQQQNVVKVYTAFAEALDAHGAPLASPLSRLGTPGMFSLLSAASVDDRRQALQTLGLNMAARTISQSLCRDIVQRLTKADLAHSMRAAWLITRHLRRDLHDAIAQQIDPDTLLSNQSAAALALALWASVLPDRDGAELLLWAETSSWWLTEPDRDDGDIAALLAAAEQVVADTDWLTENDPADAESRETAIGDGEPTDEAGTGASGQSQGDGEPGAITGTPATTTTTASAGAATDMTFPSAGAGSVGELREQITTLYADALALAQSVSTAIRDGQLPDEIGVTVIAKLRPEIGEIGASIAALTGTVPPALDRESLLAALDAHTAELAAQEASKETRVQLRRAAELTGDALCEELSLFATGTADNDQLDSGAARAVLALLRIVEIATGDADLSAVPDLFATASDGLPDSLKFLPFLAMNGRLSLDEAALDQAGTPASPIQATSSDATPADTAGLAGPAHVAAPPAEPEVVSTSVEAHDRATADSIPPPLMTQQPAEDVPARVGQFTGTRGPELDRLADEPDHAPVAANEDAQIAEAAQVVSIDLVTTHRYGLAARLAAAIGESAVLSSALRLAALAQAVRTEAGPSATQLRIDTKDIDIDEVIADEAALLLSTTALIRATLATGDSFAGAHLNALAGRLEDNLSVIAAQLGDRAMKGLLSGNPLRTVLADASDIDNRTARASSAAADWLARPHALRFQRASAIAKAWSSPEGVLGRLLTIAASDNRHQLAKVSVGVVTLSAPGAIASLIDKVDAKSRTSTRAIHGASRQDLINLASDALGLASGWVEAASAAADAAGTTSWAHAELTEMRTVVLDRAPAAVSALRRRARAATDPLLAAAASAAADSLADTAKLLAGTLTLTAGEDAAWIATDLELAKLPGTHLLPDASGINADPDLADLLAAAAAGYPAAVHAHIEAENYPLARWLLTRAAAGRLAGPGTGLPSTAAVDIAVRHSRETLTEQRNQLTASLRAARGNAEISEEQDSELAALLSIANPQRCAVGGELREDLDVVRAELGEVERRLPDYRAEAARRLDERLNALLSRPWPGVTVDAERISGLISDGQLTTAEELIYFCEIGQEVPVTVSREDFTRFFPAVPHALPSGITTDVIGEVRGGQPHPGCPALDFSEVSEDARSRVADTLEVWRRTRNIAAESRYRFTDTDLLIPVMGMLGYEFSRTQKPPSKGGRDRRWIDLTEVRWNGKAMVPQFGSKLNGRLRVLLAWEQPAARTLTSYLDNEQGTDAVLILYFGTMSAAQRRQLATMTNRSNVPVTVIDDAVLAYVAVHGHRQLTTTMMITLPFSFARPYVSQKRSAVAEEMFYGRDQELNDVINRDGKQVIYGGRGLGKSALLTHAKTVFERQPGRVAIHFELKNHDIGPHTNPADVVWDAIEKALTDRSVISATKPAKASTKAFDRVRDGIRAWLAADSSHRLLILLDEADGFFEADAPAFIQTGRLKELGQDQANWVKVVFAGLHSVQRFSHLPNNVFSHLAQRPMVIGPLAPQFAHNLITRPIEALGFAFAEPDLVHRILGYCLYQPFLLQMFGARLVEHMQDTRKRSLGDDQPPVVITRADIDHIEVDRSLLADITRAFNDTLDLDPRYSVIANVLALHAYSDGQDTRLAEKDLFEECSMFWPDGFAGMGSEGFRSYTQEMVGLGLLAANAGRGWRLRSPNVLTMIGTEETVEANLEHAHTKTPPEQFTALETRRALSGGLTSPLSASQLTDLLGDHRNQARVVLGSPATHVEYVQTALELACQATGIRWTYTHATSLRQFESELRAGRPGERRVIVSDLTGLGSSDASNQQSLRDAVTNVPRAAGVTRSVVLVASPYQLALWRTALDSSADDVGIVQLRRHDLASLTVWALEHSLFSTPAAVTALLEVTGGWPLLVENARRYAEKHQSAEKAAEEVRAELDTGAGRSDFLSAASVDVDDDLARAYSELAEYLPAGLPATAADLAGILDGVVDDVDSTIACLEVLAVFNRTSDGSFILEPVLASNWQNRVR
jgi:hypothetical protein